MSKKPIDLDPAKGIHRQHSFAERVRVAFSVEGAATDDEIARRIHVSPSALCQLFGKEPGKLQPKTVKSIIAGLQSRTLQTEVIDAWRTAVFLLDQPEEVIENAEQSLERIFTLAEQGHPRLAVRLASALLSANPHELSVRRTLYHHLFSLHLDLDELPEALDAAQALTTAGMVENDRNLLATGLFLRAQLMHSALGASPTVVLNDLKEIVPLVDGYRPSASRRHYRATAAKLQVAHQYVLLRHYEKRGTSRDDLQRLLRAEQERRSEAKSRASNAAMLRTEARIWLALDEPFKAEEVLDESDRVGRGLPDMKIKNGIFKARIMAKRGCDEEAEHIYRRLLRICDNSSRYRLHRIVSHDLATLRADKFPPARPV